MRDAFDVADEIVALSQQMLERVRKTKKESEQWQAIADFCQKVDEEMRGKQKELSQIPNLQFGGHTKYLQGLDLPIVVNSVWDNEKEDLRPSEVAEMHVGEQYGKPCLIVTPERISL